MIIQGQVGPVATTVSLSSGLQVNARAGNMGDLIVSELHGRFYEAAYRGALFSVGIGSTALTANTITLTSTTTPILGVWNPSTNNVNLCILQAAIVVYPNNLTSGAAPGPFVWASSVNNTAISTGTAPFNRKTLTNSGSNAKGLCFTALTGLTNNLVVFEGADFNNLTSLTYTTLASTSLLSSQGGIQNVDGSILVSPGGVLALLNTTSSTTFSVAGKLVWEEVPL